MTFQIDVMASWYSQDLVLSLFVPEFYMPNYYVIIIPTNQIEIY